MGRLNRSHCLTIDGSNFRERVRRNKIKSHIESLLEQERESETILELLGALFDEVRITLSLGPSPRLNVNELRAAKRISNPQAFKKYFLLKVPQSNLSLVFVEEQIDAWLSSTDNTVENLIKEAFIKAKRDDKLIEFFKVCKSIVEREQQTRYGHLAVAMHHQALR